MGCGSSRTLDTYRVPTSNSIRDVTSRIKLKKSKIQQWKSTVENLKNNKALNEYVLRKKRKDFKDISDLKKYLLAANTENDIQKVWVVYLWITHNIDYNFDGYKNHSYGKQDADSVLAAGKSVCGGFSNLFNDLCKEFQIEAKLIEGYGKGFSYNVGDKFKDNEWNHEWNAVKIGKEWHFVECTWGAGYGDKNKGYVREFQPYWFFTPSEIFIYEHFPCIPQDQLLSKPLTKEEFEMLPYLRLDFLLNDFKLKSNVGSIIVPKSNPFRLEFNIPENKKIFGSVQIADSKLDDSVFVQRNSKTNRIEIDVGLESKKDAKLVLFGGGIEEQSGNCICEFLISPSAQTHLPIFDGFCKRHLFPKDVYLFEPKEKILKLNTEYKFKVMVDAKYVAIIVSESNFKNLENESNNIWTTHYTPTTKGSLRLSARTKDDSDVYDAAFSYNVE